MITPKVHSTKVIGLKINRTASVKNSGQMARIMRVSITKLRSMAKVLFNGLMALNSLVIGRIIRWKATEYSLGLMEESIKVNTLMIKRKVKVNSSGQTAGSMMVAGRMVNSMV